MFPHRFYEHRHALDREFSSPHFDPATGMPPAELEAALKALFDEKYDTVPNTVLRAELFAFLYDNVQIEVNPLNPFAAKINHQRMLTQFTNFFKAKVMPKHSPDTLTRQRTAFEWGCVPGIDYHHTLPNWNDIQALGFFGLRDRAVKRKLALQDDLSATEEQMAFIDSVIIVYEAILRLMERIRDHARQYPEAAMFVECMTELLSHEPRTVYQSMMMTDLFMQFYEVGVENARTFGLIDRIYEPFYLADLQAGRCDEADLRELLRYLINKYSAADRWAGQPFGLGGADENGNYGSTKLTKIILEIYDELKIYNPKIHVRYHPSMPDDLLRQILDMIRRGNSSINLMSDEVVWRGYEKLGIPRSVSRDYVPQGCFEPTLMGLEEPLICCSWISIPKAIEFAINNGRDMLTDRISGLQYATSPATYQEFYQRFLLQLDTIVHGVMRVIDEESEYAHLINPSPLYSGTFASCIDNCKDVYAGGTVYPNTSVKLCGIGTAVDSLMMVKKYVYDEKRITFEELRELLCNNWEGGEQLRLDILNEKNRYGNGLAEPDNTARDIYAHAAALIVGRKNRIGGVYRMGADSVMHCIDHAVHVGATPDGRFAKAMFSKNMCSVSGMDREGVTAAMLSVLRIDTSDLLNAAVFDFIIHPSAVEGERGMDALMALTKVYFEMGGMVLQGNIFNADDLKAAQNHPEQYANLQVRVCGWNEYFVKMTKQKQDDFIKRCQNVN